MKVFFVLRVDSGNLGKCACKNNILELKYYHLVIGAFFIREFNFREDDGILGPMGSKVRRVWMHVYAAVGRAFRFATSRPFAVNKLPLVIVDRNKIQHNGIHGVWVQTFHG